LENSGKISNNKAANGGGVSASLLTMTGGTISGNTATNGGGVYITNSSTTSTMTGGTISGNTASSYGGGVYVARSGSTVGSFVKTGGTIYGYAGESTTNRNTATQGRAAYVDSSPIKLRDATAGTSVTLDSRSAGGWE
jgi:hypothetical protein